MFEKSKLNLGIKSYKNFMSRDELGWESITNEQRADIVQQLLLKSMESFKKKLRN